MKILELLTPKRRIGNRGERLAERYLRRHGYKILERNFVADGHEIDIIAERRETVAFIEVKTRTLGHESLYEPRPASAVTPEKQMKIINTARQYTRFGAFGKVLRLDVIEVYLEDGKAKEINHIEGAFNLNTAMKRRYAPRKDFN